MRKICKYICLIQLMMSLIGIFEGGDALSWVKTSVLCIVLESPVSEPENNRDLTGPNHNANLTTVRVSPF